VYLLNESIYTKVVFESIPQLFIQIVNNIALNSFSPVAVISIALAGLNTLNGFYRLIYFRFYLGIKLVNIPVHIKGVSSPDDLAHRQTEMTTMSPISGGVTITAEANNSLTPMPVSTSSGSMVTISKSYFEKLAQKLEFLESEMTARSKHDIEVDSRLKLLEKSLSK
jgi:hypothetical protein